MFKKFLTATILALTVTSGSLLAKIEYEIQDMGTLQTNSSQALAINQQGQILGWYNLDGSAEGKRFFVRSDIGNITALSIKST